jgi:hypothetical protein
MTNETEPAQLTVRLDPGRAAKLAEHVERLRDGSRPAFKVTTTAAILDLFDRGVAEMERIERDKKRPR